jgi:septal ring factor EnvC (AmiA/AmiB activator)
MGLFKRTPKTPPVDPAEVAELREQLAQLRTELASINAVDSEQSRRLEEVDGKIISLNARVTQVGTEVTHQLGELSSDIDALGERADTANANQVRLANEQARYQIAFRQDLAEVAELINKKR